MPLARALHAISTATVQPHWSLTALRNGIGIAGLVKVAMIADNLYAFASPAILKAPYPWSPPAPAGGLLVIFLGLWIAAALALIAGFRPRWSALLLAACLTYYMACDQQFFANHGALIAIAAFLLGFVYDATGRPAHDWPLFLIRYQISFVYFATGIAKLNPEFLSGQVLQEALREAIHVPLVAYPALSWLTVATELTLPFLLWIPRTRLVAFAIGFVMHTFIVLTMNLGLVVFSWITLTCYLAFWIPQRGTGFSLWPTSLRSKTPAPGP